MRRRVARFVLGFVVASVLWLGAGAAMHLALGWGPPAIEEDLVEVEIAEVEVEDDAEETPRRRRRGSRTRGSAATRGDDVPTGEATIGDDLREGEMRTIDGAGSGGEEQLSGAQVEHAFDGAMGRVRRCFLLTPGDEPVRGTLTFGLRIAGTGHVTAVNLSGPRALTAGEPGDCLREAARAIAFPSFDAGSLSDHPRVTLEARRS